MFLERAAGRKIWYENSDDEKHINIYREINIKTLTNILSSVLHAHSDSVQSLSYHCALLSAKINDLAPGFPRHFV